MPKKDIGINRAYNLFREFNISHGVAYKLSLNGLKTFQDLEDLANGNGHFDTMQNLSHGDIEEVARVVSRLSTKQQPEPLTEKKKGEPVKTTPKRFIDFFHVRGW